MKTTAGGHSLKVTDLYDSREKFSDKSLMLDRKISANPKEKVSEESFKMSIKYNL